MYYSVAAWRHVTLTTFWTGMVYAHFTYTHTDSPIPKTNYVLLPQES